MVNILKFPSRCGAIDGPDFLQEEDDILRFDVTGELTPPQSYKFKRPKPFQQNDWSNQELADLFRVKHLLNAAGIISDTDRGITDEGDPWFIFCDTQGEVLIHLCRLNGTYLLDSSNISSPLCGKNFNELLEAFTQRKLFSRDGEEPNSGNSSTRVVRFHRNGTVVLHPTTMLAALIWTLFLESEDIVMVLPDDNDETNATLDGLIELPEGSDQDIGVIETREFSDIRACSLEHIPDEDFPYSAEQHLRDLLTFNQDKINHNNYTIGLSVVAICLGFVSDARVTDVDDTALEELLVFTRNGDNAESYRTLEKIGLNESQSSSFLTALGDIFGLQTDLSEDVSNAPTNTGSVQVEVAVDGPNDEPSAFSVPDVSDAEKVASVTTDFVDKSDDLLVESMAVAGSMVSQTSSDDILNHNVTSSSDQASSADLIETVHSFGVNIQEYVVNNSIVFASFDVDIMHLEKAASLVDTSTLASQNTSTQAQLQAFDGQAHEFILFLVETKDDMEIVSMDGEWILFDMSVLDAAPEDTVVMSWSLNSGELISMVGLRNDYENFDLIA